MGRCKHCGSKRDLAGSFWRVILQLLRPAGSGFKIEKFLIGMGRLARGVPLLGSGVKMQQMGQAGEACPFEFNFDEKTFKVGDLVSYRVGGSFDGFPFVGTLVEVHPDYVVIAADPSDPKIRYRGTRESRPIVDEREI